MIIHLDKPPHFLTFDPQTRRFSEGVALTPDVRQVTSGPNEKALPAELETLTRGRVCCSSSSGIEINLSPEDRHEADGAYVWSLGGQSGFGCCWTRVSFSLTEPEELARLYGPRPKGWVAGRSAGLPVPLTPTLAAVKSLVGHRTISLEAVDMSEIEGKFAAGALDIATRILSKDED